MLDEVKIYVFGSCHYSGSINGDDAIGNGGYGVVITVNGNKSEELTEGFSNTTNSRMDIIGIIQGLKRIKFHSSITVYSTNGYVLDTLTKGWLEAWKKKGFKKKKHVDLWLELDRLITESSNIISFEHAKTQTSSYYLLAEKLGKAASLQTNMPSDLKGESSNDALFQIKENNPKGLFQLETKTEPILDSICVDASSINNPGPTEYRGVDTNTLQVIFERKYEEATNNIGEFLAIVYALALYKKENKELKYIYSDSLNAISWVKQKKCKTKLVKSEKNKEVFNHIERAIIWLENNDYNTQILKWDTVNWGQIPADYGRK